MKYNEVTKELIKSIPEFKFSNKFYEDEIDHAYNFVGFFGIYLVDLIDNLENSKKKEKNLDIIKRSFDFTNHLFNSKDPEIINLAGVSIVEEIAGSKTATDFGYRYLNPRGIKSLNDMFT